MEVESQEQQITSVGELPIPEEKKRSSIERGGAVLSSVLNPFAVPFYAFAALFLFTYLNMMPFAYKIIVLGVIYCFTILMPLLCIYLFQKLNGWRLKDLSERKKRFMPYTFTITAYLFCLLTMNRLNLPKFMLGIIVAALVSMSVCILINLKWKVSVHMIGIGGMVGGLISLSSLFNYNPVWWLCLFILLAGFLGTARIVLKHHSPSQIFIGFATGFISAYLFIY